jgi:hypothetical protein
VLAVIGTGLLWVGWFGFNGGSALSAGSRAAMAISYASGSLRRARAGSNGSRRVQTDFKRCAGLHDHTSFRLR